MKTFILGANILFEAENLETAFLKLSNYFKKLSEEKSVEIKSIFISGTIKIDEFKGK